MQGSANGGYVNVIHNLVQVYQTRFQIKIEFQVGLMWHCANERILVEFSVGQILKKDQLR